MELPHVIDAEGAEDATLRARPVLGAQVAAFRAFLDGTQRSQVIGWIGAFPLVYGTSGAVVRARTDRRLTTWDAPLVQHRVYAPLAYVPRDELERALGPMLEDTTRPAPDGSIPAPHPTLLLERATLAVSRDRERLELTLAERWCAERGEPIMIDGGIGSNEAVAQSSCAVGVVKSHRTLYAEGDALTIVLALRKGERSSVIRIAPRGRSEVLSWYLRLRDAEGRDALWGLVRVEMRVLPREAISERADELSRWLLAESMPLAAPDPRWDRMAYGIRSAEDFLRATTS
ncbi:MAG: hypothetical protein JWO39_2759 [Gemmatimonadetes bacterium]|nr:hypothetical protein [Gemmatimonadota bacterium]